MLSDSQLSDTYASQDFYEYLVKHAELAISNAAYYPRPYPHIYFERFFPADFYERLLAGFWDFGEFGDLIANGTRKALDLTDRTIGATNEETQKLRDLLTSVLVAPELEAALRGKLDAGFRIRANSSGADWPIAMHPRPTLYADFDGYSIKPHPDTRKKVLTMQIYLPQDDSQRELGTTIYKISPRGIFHWKTYGLVPEKTLPFLPNTGYAFVVIHPRFAPLSTSWHGRETISVVQGKPRLSILNTYYASPADPV
jgi:hypothetical protein